MVVVVMIVVVMIVVVVMLVVMTEGMISMSLHPYLVDQQ